MKHWLVKTEPGEYSYQQLEKDGETMWDGVRNYAARNNLRLMEKGDLVLFYHSVSDKEVVGIAKVSKTHYPDPTAEKGDWSVVDLVPFRKLQTPVTLKQIKDEPSLQNIGLVRIGRLSVMPLEEQEFQRILTLANTKI